MFGSSSDNSSIRGKFFVHCGAEPGGTAFAKYLHSKFIYILNLSGRRTSYLVSIVGRVGDRTDTRKFPPVRGGSSCCATGGLMLVSAKLELRCTSSTSC